MALLGNIYNEFFFSFHLFDVIVRSPALQNIACSVTAHFSQFMLTFYLVAIVI